MEVHLPRLHNHRQPLFGCRDRQEDWEGSFNSRSSHGSSVDKAHAVCEDKYGGLHCRCYQHIAVWQRDMNYICRAGEYVQHIPSEKHPPYHGHILAGQSNQRWCPVSCWSSQYVSLLRQRRLLWLGHVLRMDDGRIPKYIPYGELAFWEENKRSPSPSI